MIQLPLLIRWGGPTAALLGVVLFHIDQCRAISAIFLALCVIAIQSFHSKHSGAIQKTGFCLTLIGLMLMFISYLLPNIFGFENTNELHLAKFVIYGISQGFHIVLPMGLILYGVAIIRLRLFPYWCRFIPFLIGILGTIETFAVVYLWLRNYRVDSLSTILLGISYLGIFGWLPLGYELWRFDKGERQPGHK